MLRRRSRWPITIGLRLGEGKGSTVPLTEGTIAWYFQILGKEQLIRHKCGTWSPWIIFTSAATPVRGQKSMGEPVASLKRLDFVGSRNNSR
jgi:hypothetical protein